MKKFFMDTMNQAVETVERKRGLPTIGVKPTRPETGYGYIEAGERIQGSIATYKGRKICRKTKCRSC